MQKITTFLWFDTQAEEAAIFYTSLFNDSRVITTQRYGENPDLGTPGTVMTVQFELNGQTFIALNGGPQYKFSEAISLMTDCEDQAEVDKLWNALTADGGEEGRCGWLKDRFGLSWQVVPRRLPELLGDADPDRASRALQAMLTMNKIDIAAMEEAANGVAAQ